MIHILIVDDDWMSVKLTAFVLEDAGYRVSRLYDGHSVLKAIERDMPDLILLDVDLPAGSGLDICRAIRQASNIPVIFLSGLGEVADRVRGLAAGGDDYLVKPFEPTELLARIEAVLRRYDGMRQRLLIELKRAHLTLDPVDHLVYAGDGRRIELTPIEFQILYVLIQRAERVVSDHELMEAVWGDHPKGRNLLTVYVYRLRMKIWPHAADAPIVTLRGRGYMFTEGDDAQAAENAHALGNNR